MTKKAEEQVFEAIAKIGEPSPYEISRRKASKLLAGLREDAIAGIVLPKGWSLERHRGEFILREETPGVSRAWIR